MATYKRIESVKTTVAILRYLSGQREPVSGQDIAKAVETPHGTTMCHLATLEDEGLIRSVGGSFELSTGMALFHARRRSILEGRRDRIDSELKILGA